LPTFINLRRRVHWAAHLHTNDRLAARHPLRYLFLEVTRACNLACVYCGSECTPRPPSDELSIAGWIEVVRQIAADVDPRDVMVAITGGEPLLLERLGALQRELKRLGFRHGVVTNGTLLDDERAAELVDAGVGSLALSLDAPPEVNDRLRGAGTSRGVENAVAALRRAGYDGKLEIISTMTRPAVPLLEQTRRYVAQLRIPLWRLAPAMPIGRAAQREDLLCNDDDMRTMMEFIVASRSDGRQPPPEYGEEGYLGDRYERHVRPYLCQCLAGITVAGIRSDGRIGACPELADAFIQGHVDDDRFIDVWNHRYKEMRDRSWTRGRAPCDDCAAWSRCRGGSMHLYESPGAELQRCSYRMLG